MRTAIWGVIKRIPTEVDDSEVRKERLPGYYEIALTRHGSTLAPFFVDAKPSSKGNRIHTTAEEPRFPA
jgi:hypothetical protein